MRKLLLVATTLFIVACSMPSTTSGYIELVATPTIAATKATKLPTPEIVVLVAPEETAFVSLRWHLRQEPRAGGVTVCFVENEMVTIIQVDQDTGWYKVIAGGKVGWLSPLAIKE